MMALLTDTCIYELLDLDHPNPCLPRSMAPYVYTQWGSIIKYRCIACLVQLVFLTFTCSWFLQYIYINWCWVCAVNFYNDLLTSFAKECNFDTASLYSGTMATWLESKLPLTRVARAIKYAVKVQLLLKKADFIGTATRLWEGHWTKWSAPLPCFCYIWHVIDHFAI